MNKRHTPLLYLFMVLLAIASIASTMSYGSTNISSADLWQCLLYQCPSQLSDLVIWQLRVPRVLVGFVAGMGLASAGALLQNTTRNPLADPYLFGIVAGAGLGVTIASLSFGLLSYITLPISAFLGALLSISLVFALSSILQRMEHLLLTGVAVSFMFGAISQFLLYLGEPMATNRVLFWLMGSLARVEMNQFYLIAGVVLCSYLVIFALHRHIDAFALGDENAAHLGVNIQRIKLVVLVLCASLTAVIVAFCGGIGFVGLMIPHITRYLFGSNTLKLTLLSGVLGGSFLIWVDVLARSAISNLEIPIGIITSAVGSLFFLAIMFYHQRLHQRT
jgi:iron complex transport system permease protein